MVCITFGNDTEQNILCRSTDEENQFAMNQDFFENRECWFYEKALLFDGYSIWFKGRLKEIQKNGGFSLSIYFAPLGYSDQGDGLFSLFDLKRKEGFYLLLEKQGKIQIGFGNGKEIFSFRSIRAGVKKNAWNIVTVSFWEDAGWCDLYINGVLSNRKQFPRHMQVKWPAQEACIGKYIDHESFSEHTPLGIYYGLMEEMTIHGHPFHESGVKDFHGTYEFGKRTGQILPSRHAYERDLQRPSYHLIAPGKWMNEPHGPFFYEGYYHIFYQANPHAPIWNHIQWGHMVSKDMVHWEDLPLALETGEGNLDPDGCWSGSALIDKEGIPRIFYTAGNNSKFPNQFVAMATAKLNAGYGFLNEEEKKLPEWEKYPYPVVEQTLGWMGEFRDPFVWLEQDTYFMLVGTGDENNGGGNAVLYSSKDLSDWQTHGFFLDYEYEKNKDIGHVFELPVLLPLKDENGCTVCHLFLVCGCQIEGDVVENFGFLGEWNPSERKFCKFHEKAFLLDLGHGIFTGPSGFVTPDGRTVVFTIAQGMRNGIDTYHSGWAHNGGLPVALSVKDKELHMNPIREIYQLKKKKLLHLKDVSLGEANKALEEISGNQFWMRVEAETSKFVLKTKSEDFERAVYYDKDKKRFGVTDETGKELGRYRGEVDQVDIGGSPVIMEYFLDHSMIEVYLNEKKSITQRNYVKGNGRQIRLGGKSVRVIELELWEMESGY